MISTLLSELSKNFDIIRERYDNQSLSFEISWKSRISGLVSEINESTQKEEKEKNNIKTKVYADIAKGAYCEKNAIENNYIVRIQGDKFEIETNVKSKFIETTLEYLKIYFLRVFSIINSTLLKLDIQLPKHHTKILEK